MFYWKFVSFDSWGGWAIMVLTQKAVYTGADCQVDITSLSLGEKASGYYSKVGKSDQAQGENRRDRQGEEVATVPHTST